MSGSRRSEGSPGRRAACTEVPAPVYGNPVDLLVRNVRVDGQLVDVGIEDGRFVRIGPDLDADAPQTIDAGSRLGTPLLVDCHLHLDASLTAGRPRYHQPGTP